jgi:very-short-patch-repair endonuclease
MNAEIFQNKELLSKRRSLRKNQTVFETILWSRLRGRQLAGYKFTRQYSVGKYILDFYCPQYRLGIEIDGGQHDEEKALEYDQVRTKFIESQGIRIIRFWNNDVGQRIDNVCDEIQEVLKTQIPKF